MTMSELKVGDKVQTGSFVHRNQFILLFLCEMLQFFNEDIF